MTKKSEIEKSRQEARLKMDYYSNPEWSRWSHVVHHEDCNPFNNNPLNLKVITHREHRNIHVFRKFKPQFEKPKPKDHPCRFCGRITINLQCLCGRRNP